MLTEITLIQGLLIALWAFICALDWCFLWGMFHRPLIAAAVTGLILGNPVAGVIVGAMMEITLTGLVPAGGSPIPHGTLGGIMATTFMVTQGLGAPEALALALPFAFLGQHLNTAKNTFMSFVNPGADRIAAKGNARGLWYYHFFTLSVNCMLWATTAFLSAYAAQNAIAYFVGIIPMEIIAGLRLAGGLLPAVGFTMMLSIIFEAKYTPFLIIGFLISVFLDFGNVLPAALVGLAFALFYYFFIAKEDNVEKIEVGGEDNAGI